MQITPLLSGTSKTPETGPKSNVTGDFNKFLTLLTSQLQHQDPLAPMDATQFTSQLVQFSQVEQTVHMNDRIGDMLKLQEQSQVQDAVGYIGRTVDALGQEFPLANGQAELMFAVDGAPVSTAVQIFDGKGQLVRSLQAPVGAGPHHVAWDGKDALGKASAEGLYRLQVTSKDKEGKALTVQTGFSGQVKQVENVDGKMMLSLGAGIRVPLSDVVSVKASQGTSPST